MLTLAYRVCIAMAALSWGAGISLAIVADAKHREAKPPQVVREQERRRKQAEPSIGPPINHGGSLTLVSRDVICGESRVGGLR